MEDQDLDVNRYTFNYWHAYTADKYLNVNTEDSVLNVLTENAGRFSIKAAKATEFGYDVDARSAKTYIRHWLSWKDVFILFLLLRT